MHQEIVDEISEREREEEKEKKKKSRKQSDQSEKATPAKRLARSGWWEEA